MYASKAPKLRTDLIISEALHPKQAIKDAMSLIEYASKHLGDFTTKELASMELCLDYLDRLKK